MTVMMTTDKGIEDREGREAQPTSSAFAPSLVHPQILPVFLSPRPKLSINSSRYLIGKILSLGPIMGPYPAATIVGSKPIIFSRQHEVFWE